MDKVAAIDDIFDKKRDSVEAIKPDKPIKLSKQEMDQISQEKLSDF